MREPARRRHTGAERVYTELRSALLRGEVPAGARLVEQHLAARYRTSRTPVREALRRLEGDGHLVRDPSGGLRPSVPSVRSMQELYDVRAALEELTVRRAATAGDRGLIQQSEQNWRALEADWPRSAEGDKPGFIDHDEACHEAIAESSGNPTALRMLRDLNERIRPLRIHDFTSEQRIRATIDEHLEILGALLARDPDSAAAFMRAHVQRSALVVRERVGQVLTRMSSAGEARPDEIDSRS